MEGGVETNGCHFHNGMGSVVETQMLYFSPPPSLPPSLPAFPQVGVHHQKADRSGLPPTECHHGVCRRGARVGREGGREGRGKGRREEGTL